MAWQCTIDVTPSGKPDITVPHITTTPTTASLKIPGRPSSRTSSKSDISPTHKQREHPQQPTHHSPSQKSAQSAVHAFFELVQKTILPPNCRSSGNFVLKCPSVQNSKSHENHHLTPHTRRYPPYPPHHIPNNTTNHPRREIAAAAATSGNFAARAATQRQLLIPRITPTPTLCSTLMRCKD